MAACDILSLLEARLPLKRHAWSEFDADPRPPQAAVLVALTREETPRVLLGRRAMHLSLHPGEIAFAGGKREVEDQAPWDTALREAMEEVGLPACDVVPIGELAPLVTRTGFHVYPCIASMPVDSVLTVDPGEFDSVFYADLPVFADRDVFELKTMEDGPHTRRVPHYLVGSDNVWGVTAAILAQLCNVAYDAGLDLERNWKKEP